MFSKKHYERIAQMKKDQRVAIESELATAQGINVTLAHGKIKQWMNEVESLAMLFQADNSRFNKARFLHACGYHGE